MKKQLGTRHETNKIILIKHCGGRVLWILFACINAFAKSGARFGSSTFSPVGRIRDTMKSNGASAPSNAIRRSTLPLFLPRAEKKPPMLAIVIARRTRFQPLHWDGGHLGANSHFRLYILLIDSGTLHSKSHFLTF